MNPSLSDFPNFFENSILAKCVTDYQGVFTNVNAAYCDLYESKKESLIGQPFTIHFSHLSEQEKTSLIRDYQSFINSGTFQGGDFEVNKSNGGRVVVEVVRQLVHVDDKPFVITILKDITEKFDLLAALQDSEAQLKAVFESSYQAFCVIDRDLKIVRFNATTQKLSEELFHQQIRIGISIVEVSEGFYRTSFIQNMRQALQGKVVKVIHEFNVSGHNYWLRFVFEPLADRQGQINTVLVSVVNVTQRVLAEQKINEKNKQLRQVIQAQKDQLYFISHDLKSPFDSILGITKILQEETSPQELKQYLGYIKKLSEQGLDIINMITQAGMIENEVVTPQRRTENLSLLMKDLVQSHKMAARRKGQTMQADIDDGIILKVDKNMIKSVVDNLLSNAIKYSPVYGSITVNLSKGQENVSLEVKDDGLGMTPSDMQQLFKKFSRLSARPTGGEKSSGLGLFITKNFVEAHDGVISAQSDGPNQGTKFTVQLPVCSISERDSNTSELEE